MDTTSLENLLQAAAVDQLIGYEGNQTAQNLLQDVQGGQNKYPAYLEDMANSNSQDAASFGDNLINDGNFSKCLFLFSFFYPSSNILILRFRQLFHK